MADTSIWIDHLRSSDAVLAQLLDQGKILIHPFIIGEIALGTLSERTGILSTLAKLPQAMIAKPKEVSELIEKERLHGLGVGYVDVHLLASTLLTADVSLWTRDRRLNSVAERMGIAARLTH